MSKFTEYKLDITPKNKKLPTGTYFYILYLNDTNTTGNTILLEQTYTGWVYLQNN